MHYSYNGRESSKNRAYAHRYYTVSKQKNPYIFVYNTRNGERTVEKKIKEDELTKRLEDELTQRLEDELKKQHWYRSMERRDNPQESLIEMSRILSFKLLSKRDRKHMRNNAKENCISVYANRLRSINVLSKRDRKRMRN